MPRTMASSDCILSCASGKICSSWTRVVRCLDGASATAQCRLVGGTWRLGEDQPPGFRRLEPSYPGPEKQSLEYRTVETSVLLMLVWLIPSFSTYYHPSACIIAVRGDRLSSFPSILAMLNLPATLGSPRSSAGQFRVRI
jgi:hypothetical protein